MATATATETTTATRLEDMNTVLKPKAMDTVQDVIQTEVYYLIKDPKHEHEKAYELRYDHGGVIPTTNMSHEPKPVQVHNFRPLQNSQNFKEYGFSSTKINCTLSAAEFEDEKRVEAVYYPAIEKALWQMFPDAAEIKILEHRIRKRHEQFHAETEELFEYSQPATIVHVDFSPMSAARSATAAFKVAPNQYRRILAVNVWKSFHGPGNDWPLALCDPRTMDRNSEAITADIVYHNRYTENERFYYNPKHEWYYFKDLDDDEVILFRQTDSDLEGGGGVAHTGFYNPKADEHALRRSSIELRSYMFYR